MYDFDGTLYDSPANVDPTSWLYVRSLDHVGPPGFDRRWNMDVLIQARRSLQDPLVHTILVTARPDYREMRRRIQHLLFEAGLDFEEVHLKPLSPPVSAEEYKAAVVAEFLEDQPEITRVVVYDDLESIHEAIYAEVASRGIRYDGIVA